LPSGAAALLTDTNANALLSSTQSTTLVLTLNTTNIAEGIYTFSLNGSGGATNSVLYVLQAGHIWNGVNGGLGVSNLWSAASAWLGGLPGTNSDVIFGDIAAQTNATYTNSVVDVNTTIGSLRFSQTGVSNSIAN